jgi:hypothetical protein
MPRSKVSALPVMIGGGLVLALAPSLRTRRRGASLVARRVGRLVGSIRRRTLYV